MENLPAKTDAMNDLSRLLLTQQQLPFLQLITFNSTVLGEDNPDLKPGDFFLSRGSLNLGNEFMAILTGVRSYAYVRKGPSLLFDTFDTSSDNFAQAITLEKRKKQGWRAKWGGMTLLYIPEHDIFCTYFLAGPGGGRQCLEQVLPYMGKSIMFTSKLRKSNAGHRWYSPTALIGAGDPPVLPENIQAALVQFEEREGVEAKEEDDR